MSIALSILKRPYAEIDLLRMALDSRITFTRASTQMYYNASNVLSSAATDVCPLRYDPSTGLVAGRASWEARTNLVPYSQDISNAAWTTSNLSVNATAAVAPDGTTTANLLTVTATAATVVYQYFTALGTAPHTMSIYTKSGSGATAVFLLRNNTTLTNFTSATFTYATGTISGANWSVQAITNGWYRLSYTQATGITSGNSLALYAGHIGGTATAGQTHYVWGAQCEQASSAGPYIPTTSVAVTRAVDTATITNLASLNFNAAAGTLYATVTAPASTVNAATLFSFNDNTANKVLRIRMGAGGALKAQVIDGGVTQADLTLATLTAGQAVRVAMAYAANDIRACLNGGTVQLNTSATLPTVDRMMIGRTVAGESWNANMRAMRVYRRALANSELQALTS